MGHTEGVAGQRGRYQVGAASPNVKVTGVRPGRGSVASSRGLSTREKVVVATHPHRPRTMRGGGTDAGAPCAVLWLGCP